MKEEYLTFQKFNDIELANEIADRLKESNIDYRLENNHKLFDPSFANNSIQSDISITLKPHDFSIANRALEKHYESLLESVEKDYYLFEFTDEELIEIISKPDEWGHFDYQLAKKILKDKGKEVKPEIAELLRAQRNKDLAKPDTPHKYWIYVGYFSALLGGIFGILIGWTFAFSKKTLPNGQRIHAYSEKERDHGSRMLLLSSVSLILWIFIRLRFLSD